MKITELLITCPCCGQPNFSTRGLSAHWCKAKQSNNPNRRGARLNRSEWMAAVAAAKREQQNP